MKLYKKIHSLLILTLLGACFNSNLYFLGAESELIYRDWLNTSLMCQTSQGSGSEGKIASHT